MRTTTTVATLAAASSVGIPTPVAVVVTDTEAIGVKTNPPGTVTFSSSVVGDAFSAATCTLAPVGGTTE